MTDAQRTDALERLMDAYGTDIKRLCTLQLGDRMQAEDAAQEVFIKAWKALDSFRGESSEKTWLIRIAVNTCRDYQRTGWFRLVDRRVTPEELPLSAREEPLPDQTITSAIRALPQKFSMVIVLRYYEAMTIRETASAMHASVHTVKRRLDRANDLLRNRLKEWYCDA